jgi:hypothetical protein
VADQPLEVFGVLFALKKAEPRQARISFSQRRTAPVPKASARHRIAAYAELSDLQLH